MLHSHTFRVPWVCVLMACLSLSPSLELLYFKIPQDHLHIALLHEPRRSSSTSRWLSSNTASLVKHSDLLGPPIAACVTTVWVRIWWELHLKKSINIQQYLYLNALPVHCQWSRGACVTTELLHCSNYCIFCSWSNISMTLSLVSQILIFVTKWLFLWVCLESHRWL